VEDGGTTAMPLGDPVVVWCSHNNIVVSLGVTSSMNCSF